MEVKVLAEELAYNKKYNQYKMFIVGSPLVEIDKGYHRDRKGRDGDSVKEVLLSQRRTLADHLEVLQYFSRHKEVSITANAMFKHTCTCTVTLFTAFPSSVFRYQMN